MSSQGYKEVIWRFEMVIDNIPRVQYFYDDDIDSIKEECRQVLHTLGLVGVEPQYTSLQQIVSESLYD